MLEFALKINYFGPVYFTPEFDIASFPVSKQQETTRDYHIYVYIYIYILCCTEENPCAPKPGLVRHRACAACGCGLCGRLVRQQFRRAISLCGRLVRHKPLACGRPACGAQAAAQANCSTELLVRLVVLPRFTARMACAGLCGNFFGGNFIQYNTVYIYIYILV